MFTSSSVLARWHLGHKGPRSLVLGGHQSVGEDPLRPSGGTIATTTGSSWIIDGLIAGEAAPT